MRKQILTLAGVLALTAQNPAFAAMEDLPGVPLSVVESVETPVPVKSISLTPNFSKPTPDAGGAPPADQAAALKAAFEKTQEKLDKSLYDTTKVGLNVIPGENMILPIAVASPNRLLTPFFKPRVTTASDAQITVDHSVVYITPTSEELVTMFITEEEGNQRNAISLTMVPRKIPPREVRLLITGEAKKGQKGAELGMDMGAMPFDQIKASEWEKGNDYTDTIRDTMRELALGKTPSGYGLRRHNAQDPQPHCADAGFSVQPGQSLDGHNIIAVVSVLTNTTKEPRHFQASSCYQPGVLAAAAWPKSIIAPGAKVELYTLHKRPDPAEEASTRPSLIDGGR